MNFIGPLEVWVDVEEFLKCFDGPEINQNEKNNVRNCDSIDLKQTTFTTIFTFIPMC